ncbi:Mitochondrial import inner membrane translocase subunit tim22 [Ceratocystis pirilliformis]|uniref:Mitochondrial import inner membrane translocase subunit TIM22 n=1 Tax=Ceratocystis pirilliformis TaxID=259994 RepID=A0ABR3YHW1_9PEZI
MNSNFPPPRQPSAPQGFPGFSGLGQTSGSPEEQQKQMEKMMESAMQNCVTKGAISGVMGFGMGGLFGMFMASMAYDTPYHTTGGAATNVSSLPIKQQLAVGFKDMGARSWSSAKSFGRLGALYAGIECGIEGFRAKHDLMNSAYAGCLAGGIISRNNGPMAAVSGCAAFAAFGVAIDAWMRTTNDDDF